MPPSPTTFPFKMSSYTCAQFLTPHRSALATHHRRHDSAQDPYSPPYSSPLSIANTDLWPATAHSQPLPLLHRRVDSCMNAQAAFQSPFSPQEQQQIYDAWSQYLPLDTFGVADALLDYQAPSERPLPTDWSMYPNPGGNAMGAPATAALQGLRRQQSHQRTPSASTVATNEPASPYTASFTHPQIANTDFAPVFDHSTVFSKDSAAPTPALSHHTYLSANYLPGHSAQFPTAHLAMKGFASDHHNFEDFNSDLSHSGRHSMSSISQGSPATPRSGAGDSDAKPAKAPTSTGENALRQRFDSSSNYLLSDAGDYRTTNPDVHLSRTESAAYQDELYNPANFNTAPTSVSKPPNQYLSPSSRRNLVTERLQTANIARSDLPSTTTQRGRSPFREGSQLAPTDDWQSPRPAIGTAAGMRQQLKEEREQAEYAQHRPQLQREPTKTISPKDALLEYNEPGQPPLFQDTVPAGYKQHFGGTEQYPNAFFGQANAAYGVPATTSQNMTSYRATSADGFSGGNFNYSPPNYQAASQVQSSLFHTGNYQQASAVTSPYPVTSMADHVPDFPATLTSMESSASDQGPLPSSQDGGNVSTLQRPADTRAGTGTYTCTYHGCAQRFDSHANLQKHKREFHRSQQPHRETLSVGPSSSSPHSPHSAESPTSSTAGMTSDEILARNSQAGPHKCSRINPSTGKPCNTVFSRPYDLTRHEDTIHSNRKQKVRCPYCREEKTFSRNDALTRHMRVVHPDVEAFGKRGRRGE